jgi:diguanylate cyclase (GGDEF)-like protein
MPGTAVLIGIIVGLSGVVLVLAGAHLRDRRRLNKLLGEAAAARREAEEAKGHLALVQKKLEGQSRTDVVTGLPNRRDMLERIEEERIRFERNRKPFALVMADLDRFKIINDAHGHDSGDYLLKGCASMLRASLRKQDRVCRWGTDEFLLLLPGTDYAGGRTILEMIRKRIAETSFAYKGKSLKTGLSLGLCIYRGGQSVDDAIREAGDALEADKKKGRHPRA